MWSWQPRVEIRRASGAQGFRSYDLAASPDPAEQLIKQRADHVAGDRPVADQKTIEDRTVELVERKLDVHVGSDLGRLAGPNQQLAALLALLFDEMPTEGLGHLGFTVARGQ